jgi:hypothetical protein
MQFAENLQFNWQEGHCFIMTVPDSVQPEQPGREFKNYSEKFLNIRLTPNLAPSDIHLLGPLKNYVRGKRFADGEEVETEVRKWLRYQLKDFCAAGFGALVKRWDNCINVRGGYVEK